MSPENILHFSHGLRWKGRADTQEEDGEMEVHSATSAIPFEKIVRGDTAFISETIHNMSEEFHAQLMQKMYALVSRTCEKSGNVVSSSQDGFPEAFEAMLEKIEFGVDRSGKVSVPQLHAADTQWMVKALEGQPDEYHQRIQCLIDRKSAEARESEELRKSKFKEAEE
jgi:hypothetical protein